MDIDRLKKLSGLNENKFTDPDIMIEDAKKLANTMAKNFVGLAYERGDPELAHILEQEFRTQFDKSVARIHKENSQDE